MNDFNLSEDQTWITQRDLASRKAALGVTPEVEARLLQLLPVMEPRAEEMVARLLSAMAERQDVAQHFAGRQGTRQRLRASLVRYVGDLFSGRYDADYANKRINIGQVHEWVGVPPRLFVWGLRQLMAILFGVIDETLHDPADLTISREAVRRILLFDAHLVFDVCVASWMSELAVAGRHDSGPAKATLAENPQRDFTTGLFNRAAFDEQVQLETLRAKRRGESFCLAHLQLCGAVSPGQGKQATGEVLIQVAKSLIDALRETDVCARTDHTRFSILMPTADGKAAMDVCRRIIRRFQGTSSAGVSFCMGVAQNGPQEHVEHQDLWVQAERALGEAVSLAQEKPGFYLVKDQREDVVELPSRL